ncbi:MAG: TetR/AcrR family transcriptional regulator [Pseudomonadota bacterium]
MYPDSARGRSRERLEERERSILDAATDLFASAGFSGTSTRRIASEAGVSEGTVFHYFGSKHDLLVAILDRFYNETLNPNAADVLDNIMGTDERLHALARYHITALTADQAIMLRLLQVYTGEDLSYLGNSDESPLRALNRNYVGYLDRIVREGMERGELRPDLELRAVRDLFFGTLEYGTRTLLLRHGKRLDTRSGAQRVENYLEELLAPVLRGLMIEDGDPESGEQLLDRLEQSCERLDKIAERMERG